MTPESGTATQRRPTARSAAGDVALVSAMLALLAGALLATFFDPREPYRSISEWLLSRPAVALLRNVHYWAAQLALLAALLEAWRCWRTARGRVAAARGVALLALAAGAMLTGFLLRGDGDAREVQRHLGMLAGAGGGLAIGTQIVFALHVAAAVAIVAIVLWALKRVGLPRGRVAIVVATVVGGLSLFLSPGLHDGSDPAFHGPWYFTGLQRGLDAGVPPPAILAALLAAVAAMAALAWLPARAALWARRLLGALALAYLAACAVGLLAQDEGDGLRFALPDTRGDLRAGWVFGAAPLPEVTAVRGRAEGCLACHGGIEGLGASHAPTRIGCAACHGGDPFARDAAGAHAHLVRVPGNLADARRTCGQAECHLATVPRVERSIMSTMAGVIAVNRRVLGEPVDPAAPPPHAAELGHGVADSHLRELCVGCHLGQPKTDWGPIGEESLGGGCNACHLVYGKDAAAALARYDADKRDGARQLPAVHPSLTVNPGNEHCFGCHSRSSRISTSYEGWNELRGEPPAHLPAARLRKLDDGRHFEKIVADVHHERGLECIDCHVSGELMGTGRVVARKSEQVIIGCEDCHARSLASIAGEALDPESRRLLAARQWTVPPSARVGATRGGVPLVNVTVDAQGRGSLRRKRTGEVLPLKPPAAVCTEGGGHARLACISCHTAWAPRCTTCHTQYDPSGEGFDHLTRTWGRGTWNETAGPFEAVPPTLGVRAHRGDDGAERGVIETFVPGMIMTFDRNRDPSAAPDVLFRRLYGLTFAHTIRREARSCESCHRDPVALGYGEGTLSYHRTADGGRWRFAPQQAASAHDGLPTDAWIGFLQPREGMASTRDDVRPFGIEEQRRILRVGACLTCHAPGSPALQGAVADFDAVLARRSRRCLLPLWP